MLVTFQGARVCWIPCGWGGVCGHPVLGQSCSVYLMGLRCVGYPVEWAGYAGYSPDVLGVFLISSEGAGVLWVPCGGTGVCLILC